MQMAARSVDDRWVRGTLRFELRPVEGFANVMLNQDIFNLFL